MIISHANKFIFLKTEKTAGTSIEIALSEFCGPDDIITPISDEDEAVRKVMGFRGPQNFQEKWIDYSLKDLIKTVKSRKLKRCFFNHIQAKQVIPQIDPDVWDKYYKFCFERNPFDRSISQYFWKTKNKSYPEDFAQFVQNGGLNSLKKSRYYLYTIGGNIVVDRICKYENFSEELEFIKQKLNLSKEIELPKTKLKYRKDKGSYRDFIDEMSRKEIEGLFKDELYLLNYQW